VFSEFRSADAGVCSPYLPKSWLPGALLVLLFFRVFSSIISIIIFDKKEVMCMSRKLLKKLLNNVIEFIVAFGISFLAGIALLT
jgi:hypothetical protein